MCVSLITKTFWLKLQIIDAVLSEFRIVAFFYQLTSKLFLIFELGTKAQ